MNDVQITTDVITLAVIRSGIRLATPIILGALGFSICSRAGVLNFAIEGMMLFGAFSAIVAAFLLGNTYLGVAVAILATVFGSGHFAARIRGKPWAFQPKSLECGGTLGATIWPVKALGAGGKTPVRSEEKPSLARVA